VIVCATPRCGGTIFSINKAAELGIQFSGELSTAYVTGLGNYGSRKKIFHETHFQTEYSLQNYVEHLRNLTAPDRLFLINANVGLALPLSSFRIATRDIMRAFRSMADLVIRSYQDRSLDEQYEIVTRFCRLQLEANLLITEYCRLTGSDLQFFEDLFTSKVEYPHLEAFPHLRRLEKYFSYLKHIEKVQLPKT
jgi:hypothetical protein